MSIRKTSMLAVALVMLLQGGVRAGERAQAPARPVTLTALDYIEIQQLVSRYARAIDTCSNNGYDYADLFTADGYFAPAQDGAVGTRWQGREKLAEVSGGGVRGCKNVGWIRQGVHHLYENHIITPTADGATGTVEMLMIGLDGDPYRIRHDGYYADTYAKTPQGWRFASRIHHVAVQPATGASVPPQGGLTADDGAAIQHLSARYAELLGACKAADYAALFAAPDGYFFSTFRGKVQGRDALIRLVESERHCIAGTPRASSGVPLVAIEPAAGGARGVAKLANDAGQYEDVYVRTADGWRFASRSVFTPQEVAARTKPQP